MYQSDETVVWDDDGPNPYKHTCLRCNWVWIRRTAHKPKTCANPECRSAYWDMPPKRKKKSKQDIDENVSRN